MTRNNKHDSNCNLNIVLIVIIAALIIHENKHHPAWYFKFLWGGGRGGVLTPLQTMDLYELWTMHTCVGYSALILSAIEYKFNYLKY